MAVNKKGMRKVNFKGRQYLWNIQEQPNQQTEDGAVVSSDRWVRIIDNKKQFIVRYRIPQEGDHFAILVNEGSIFPQRPDAREVQVPRWKHDSKRYPTADFVRRLIGWCMESE